MLSLRSAAVIIVRGPTAGFGVLVLSVCALVWYLCLENSRLGAALAVEHSFIVSAREEVVDVRKKIAVMKKLLRDAAPNIVLPNMAREDIRTLALLIVEINDLGTDESGMGYSTTTLVNSQGACITYAFKVDERNLDPVSRLMFKAGRIAVEKNKQNVFTRGVGGP